MQDILQTVSVYAIPVLLAITLHEAAHGYVARLFGDDTAYRAGRVTLNPRRPKQQMIWVAAAGPGANLAMAVGWALLMRLQFSLGLDEAFFLEMAKAGVFMNIGLMALNLLPVPPLDGGRILIGLLPPAAAVQVARIEPYGMFVVLGRQGSGRTRMGLRALPCGPRLGLRQIA